ncbi:MAG: M20/M25/M40 family metallo-hydrolase [Bacteroidia bacterium]|nr:M20/M25/M40 family metallo-hydrolase [Bacteroidia bacterium]
MRRLFTGFIFIVFCFQAFSQDPDSLQIKKIFDEALTSKVAYENLKYLCKNTAGRICGTSQSLAAVEYAKKIMQAMGLDTLYLQEMMVPHWIRGEKETGGCTSMLTGAKYIFNICALGYSVGTGKNGITAEVIEVKNFDELKNLGEKKVKGKIVFFNRAADQTQINTFRAYGGAADQRMWGAIEAAKLGAVAVVIRSLTLADDENPHTGVMHYKDSIVKIPAVAIATKHADQLSDLLRKDASLKFYIKTTCSQLDDVKSYNVIGEIRGSEKQDEIITVGGHLDAWDNGGEGAHDDGCGCMQAVDVLRIFKATGTKPKRTIRAVLFMDEEMAQRGGKKYAEAAKEKNEKHIIAIESDVGCLSPHGFSIDAAPELVDKFLQFTKIFEPYGLYEFFKGYGGVDIYPLKQNGVPVVGLVVENQRYFDYHHSPSDVFENVNRREMQMGSGALAGLIYLIDKYGF